LAVRDSIIKYVTPTQLQENAIIVDQTLNGAGYMVRNVAGNEYETFNEFFGRMIGKVGVSDNFPVSGDTAVANTGFINNQVTVFLNKLKLIFIYKTKLN